MQAESQAGSQHAPSSLVRRPEILAPAGDWECVRAAVENGADAVYFGLERFNARMRAKNFTQADLPELMAFLHTRGVRGYVTFNTLVFSNELADAEHYLRSIIAAGVDAAIVQDVGICRMIRALSPDFPIHCSTQMTITSDGGVRFARDLGAQLVVLARENTLEEIAAIQRSQAETGFAMPLEVFVHGALCVAFSGQCLTSESLGGRSANRGECAQACRLPYELVSDGQSVPLGDRRYLLSPQDLAGVEVLPELLRVGVCSLKIEGRLKAPEYVASITRVYRQALDRAVSELTGEPVPPFDPSAARYELEMSFSRGLYTGWFKGIDNQELAHARFGTKRGVFVGTVRQVAGESVVVDVASSVKPGDGVVFDAGRPDAKEEGGRIYQADKIDRNGIALRFGTGDLDLRRVRPGQRVWKTNDPALDRAVRATFEGDQIRFQRPVDFEVHGRPGGELTVLADDRCGHVVRAVSSARLEVATKQPLTPQRLEEQFGRLGGTAYKLGRMVSRLEGDAIVPLSELNRLRRDLVQQLDAARSRPQRWSLREEALSAPSFAAADSLPAKSGEVIAVLRRREQLPAAWAAGIRTLYCEFENPKHYRDAVADFRGLAGAATDASIWVAAPRIFKPGEEWILKQVRSSEADGYLIRNYDHLAFFAGERKRGDFSLNVANPWTAEYYLEHYGLERVTASYDLNIHELEALLRGVPGERLDITVHQRMPMFHMNHCVFCAFMSSGKDYHDCGRPCEKHRVALRDRVGAELPLQADAGCRNTVYNNRAQTGAEYVERLQELGARSFRVEFVGEEPADVERTLRRYRDLLSGALSGAELWKELKLINQLGVTRGQIDAPRPLLQRKMPASR